MPRGERDRAKELFWRKMVQHWRCSGRRVRDFCAEHGLAEASFYAWRRTIAERDRQARRRHAERHPPVASPAAFVPVRVTVPTAPDQPAALEVVLGAKRVVRVPAGFDAGTLRQLLVVLEEAPSC